MQACLSLGQDEEVDSSTDKVYRRHRVLLANNNELTFAMRPLQSIRLYRHKMRRNFRRKCRNPVSEVRFNLFMLRNECQSGGSVKRFRNNRRSRSDRERRLDALVGRLTAAAKRPAAAHVPINPWRSGRADLQNLVLKGGGSQPGSPISYTGTGIKVVNPSRT